MNQTSKIINIQAIRIDGGTQSRVSLNESTVSDYADLITDGVALPPVVVFYDGSDHWLADGFHRFHAFSKAGKAGIPANIIKGTCRDAKLYAAGANGTHGLSRTNQDKRRAVEMVLEDADCAANWTDREIAKHCAVSVPFVGAIRRPETAQKQQAHRNAQTAQAAEKCNPITPTLEVGALQTPQRQDAPAPEPAPANEPDELRIDPIEELERAYQRINELEEIVESLSQSEMGAECAKQTKMRQQFEALLNQRTDQLKTASDDRERMGKILKALMQHLEVDSYKAILPRIREMGEAF